MQSIACVSSAEGGTLTEPLTPREDVAVWSKDGAQHNSPKS